MGKIESKYMSVVTVLNNLKQVVRMHNGELLPDDYLCVDLETSGFDRKRDVILQYGHCLVENRQVVERLSVVINWFESDVPAVWLEERIRKTARAMELEGKAFHLTAEKVRAGVPPVQALPQIMEIIKAYRDSKVMLVMHNGLNFDVEMLQSAARTDLGYELEFGAEDVFDTGVIVKASQIKDYMLTVPLAGETFRDYQVRINGFRTPGIHWSLNNFCVEFFGLAIDPAGGHDADQDAYALHLLMEKFRELTSEN